MAWGPGEPVRGRLALLLLALLPLGLFWAGLAGGQVLWGGDAEALGLPFGMATRRALQAGAWPHWLPELMGGLPSLAGTNTDFLYPSVLLMHLAGLPLKAMPGLDAALHVGLAGLGLYGLARSLGASPAGSLLGGAAFALSGSQLSILFAGHANNVRAIALIPWAFWAAQAAWASGRWGPWGLAGLVLGLQNLALGMQISAYTGLGLAGFAAWSAWKDGGGRARWLRALGGLGLTAGLGFLLAAPQLLPSLEYKPHSWREGFGYEQFTSWSFHPKEALAWVVPGFFGWREPTYHGAWPFSLTTEYFGLLPWVLAAAALLPGAWRGQPRPAQAPLGRRIEGFLLLLALFAFLSALGGHFPLHHLYYRLPVFNGFRSWTRFLALLTVALCVLAALGWDRLQRPDGQGAAARRGALAAAGLALLLALLALGLAPSSVARSSQALAQKLGPGGPSQALQLAQASAYKAGMLALLLLAAFTAWDRLRGGGRWLALGGLALLVADAGEVARRYVAFKPAAQVLPKPAGLERLPDPAGPEPYRLWDPQGAWPQNAAAAYGYEQWQGYHGMQMAAPLRLQQALQERQLDWLALGNVRYVVLARAQALPPDWKPVPGQAGPLLYENPGAWPRARLLGQARGVDSDAQALELLRQGAPLEPALVRGAPDLPQGPLQGWARFVRRAPHRLELSVQASRPALLLLSQTWYPAWRARVDGRDAPLLSAYGGALSAVAVPAGGHRVELWYEPTALRRGLALAALGALALAGLLAWERRLPAPVPAPAEAPAP